MDERDALLLLSLTPGLGPVRLRRCIEAFGSASGVLGASVQALASLEGFSLKRAGDALSAAERLRREGAHERELELVHGRGVTLLSLSDPGYPALLRHTPDPPLLLYLYGELAEEDSLALAVVGTRKPTQYGLEQTDRLTGGVARAGMCIVSGGAYGIDAAAHRAAMSVGARTIAVLGNGLLKPYPAEHTELFERIADGNGAVLSEFPMGMAPMRENFPRRNRIVSGLALGVLVVEADERSGALITARLAVEDHNREVMAVPGRVDAPRSAGCHKILREGWATLVTKPAEILEQLGEAGQMLRDAAEATPTRNARRTSRAGKSNKPDDQAGLFDATPASGEPKAPANLTQTQQSIWAHLAEPLPLERLTELTGMDVGQLQAELTMLEIQGQVRREGNRLRRGG